jgi:5-(carboxyamino)imidazole ribonucleotide mutase
MSGNETPIPLVGVVMGSISDWSTMEHCAQTLSGLGISHETRIVSAHRMPVEMAEYASTAHERGVRVIIAGAGGAAHLPGMIAAQTLVPVLGVPIPSTALQGTDSLLSIVQMPAGVPVATFAIGKPGAINAALFAAAILAAGDTGLAARLAERRVQSHDDAVASQSQLSSTSSTQSQPEEH